MIHYSKAGKFFNLDETVLVIVYKCYRFIYVFLLGLRHVIKSRINPEVIEIDLFQFCLKIYYL